MTPNQIARLTDLQDRLVETVISDADPLNWTASGMTLAEMSAADRGDAAWCRKTAVLSVSLLIRVQQLLEPKVAAAAHPNDPDPEADIKRAERAASDMLARVGLKADAAKR
jgi:hypothetical protein